MVCVTCVLLWIAAVLGVLVLGRELKLVLRRRFGKGKPGAPVPYRPVDSTTRPLVEQRWGSYTGKYEDSVFVVTGGFGSLARQLVRALVDAGAKEVRIIDVVDGKPIDPRVKVHKGSILSQADAEKVLRGADVVFHVASLVDSTGASDDSMTPVNVHGTQNLVTVAQRVGVKKFIYTSSAAVLESGEGFEGDESAPYPAHFLDMYARTKAEAERFVLSMNGEAGMLTAAVRFHMLYGPGTLINNVLFEHAEQYYVFTFPAFPQSIAFIDNVVHAHRLVFEKLTPASIVSGKTYNISDNRPLTYPEFVKDLRSAMGVKPALVGPPIMANALGFAIEYTYLATYYLNKATFGLLPIYRPIFARVQMGYAYDKHVFSTKRAEKELGFKPVVPYEEALKRIAAHYAK